MTRKLLYRLGIKVQLFGCWLCKPGVKVDARGFTSLSLRDKRLIVIEPIKDIEFENLGEFKELAKTQDFSFIPVTREAWRKYELLTVPPETILLHDGQGFVPTVPKQSVSGEDKSNDMWPEQEPEKAEVVKGYDRKS